VSAFAVRVLSRPEVAAGFALAGLSAVEASDAEDAARELAALANVATVGVVLVQSDLWEAVPEELRRTLGRRAIPMIVPFPAPRPAESGAAAEDYIVEILRQAIGYRVRLR
jgi:vacuolar-type H+-ATPase subunit F/Vma7